MRTIPEQHANPQLTGPVAVNAPHATSRASSPRWPRPPG
jgi:hypothetical protein